MAHLKLLMGAAMAVTLAGGANAQVQTITEAVPTADTEIVRAQHIRIGDVSPEEYKALLDEAARYNAYQSTASAYTDTAASTETTSSYNVEIYAAPAASSDMVATTYSAPSSSTYATTTYAAPATTTVVSEYPMAKTYPLGTDFSSAEFSAQSATTTYAAPVTTGTTTTYAAPVSAGTTVTANAPTISYGTTSYSAPAYTAPTTTYQSTTQSSHYVVKGDTLYNIAKRNNVSVAELKSANGLSSNNIGLGQTLIIPGNSRVVNVETNTFSAPVTSTSTATVTQPYVSSSRPTLVRNVEPLPAGNNYAVLPKDTLYSISRRACVSVSDIRAVNGNLDPQTLQPGQRLTLPGGHCMR